MRLFSQSKHARLLSGVAFGALLLASGAANAQAATPAADTEQISIAAQPLASALYEYGTKTGRQVMFTPDVVTRSKTSSPVFAAADEDGALRQLLAGTGLTFSRRANMFVIQAEGGSDPQSGSAAGGGAEVEALIVTAQKREEDIQDVPIAMSAFSQEDLTRSQVATGADLMTQVPNMTFTKTNFTSFSIQLRGIGTQAISATVDPAVAVAFNSTPFLRAHFFEQEFYDMQRVEVLRGPQGTLYGRNATAGVVNLISQKPKFTFEARASGDIANYSSSRIEGMVNLPLVEDQVALRLAGAWTKRDGFVTNENTGDPTDGRDLWSTRLSLRVTPNDRLDANFVWEHFEEDDDRLRSGKQTCKQATTPATIGGVATDQGSNGVLDDRRYLNQGCVAASVYSPDAFQTPDGRTLPFYLPLGEIGAPILGNETYNVYASDLQTRDLRVIQSDVDPSYRASSDTLELNVDFDLSDHISLASQTGYQRDFLFSTQDYNRFNTRPGAFVYCPPYGTGTGCSAGYENYNGRVIPRPGGPLYGPDAGPELFGQPCADLSVLNCYQPAIFCDPQIGCSDKLVLMDLATGRSRQFSQEFRVASSFDSRFNFSLGANYMRYKTLEDYYVFINSITLVQALPRNGDAESTYLQWGPGYDNTYCLFRGFDYFDPAMPYNPQSNLCGYIDPNPVTDLNGQGHNYFRSQNPYKLQSYAIFGEAYYDIAENLKLTAGLRWTVDQKEFQSIPSQILTPAYGYPTLAVISQEWREPTGRLVLDWKPKLAFTDETMIYASFSHGYKAGGANPPGAVLLVNRGGDIPFPTHPATFAAEFINAYEVGTKNTLLDGKLTFNLTGFYYDYTDYQISEIVDRSAINLNFDAKVWGVELETDWRPLENLRFGVKVGYEDTRVADGEKGVDLMDRANGGRPDENGVSWVVIKPFPTQASNCIMPDYVVAALLLQGADVNLSVENACTSAYLGVGGTLRDPVTGRDYVANPTETNGTEPIPEGYIGFNPYTAPNRGAGIDQDLSGNMLPNAPHWTGTLTADYTVPLPSEWLMTLHTDLYYQSEAWTRIFNMEGFDKLKAYTNVNLAAIFSNEDAGWTVMAYVKNIFDKDNITGAFLNSDDTGLTNNVFLNEPRLYGLRVTKAWNGASWWDAPATKDGPLRVELDGFHGKIGNDQAVYTPPLASLFSDTLRFPAEAQNDLAASNGGGVRVSWQPQGSRWSLSGGVRYGRAGGGTQLEAHEDPGEFCLAYSTKYCRNPGGLPNGSFLGAEKYGWHNYFNVSSQTEESHTFADFTVGADVGLGHVFGDEVKSTFSAGIGYGRLGSSTKSELHGRPDLYFPDNWITIEGGAPVFHASHFQSFDDRLKTGREFEGWGPQLGVDVELPLIETANEARRLALDVGLDAVVLFGKQSANVEGQLTQASASGDFRRPSSYGTTRITTALDIAPREKDVTVPGVRANLGLGYTLGGFKLGAGYRWERYYDAIDGGFDERETYDRTFEGPYMSVSVGFGG